MSSDNPEEASKVVPAKVTRKHSTESTPFYRLAPKTNLPVLVESAEKNISRVESTSSTK